MSLKKTVKQLKKNQNMLIRVAVNLHKSARITKHLKKWKVYVQD